MFRLEIQEMVKDMGLKSVQIIWEQKKVELENQFRSLLLNLERTDSNMARIVKQNRDKMIETIEGDLYPERKKNKGNAGLIWFIVIAGVLMAGIIGFVWWKKRKKNY